MNLKEELIKAEEERKDKLLRESYKFCKDKLVCYFDVKGKIEFCIFYKLCPKCGRKNTPFCMNYKQLKFCYLSQKIIETEYLHILLGKNSEDEEIFKIYYCGEL